MFGAGFMRDKRAEARTRAEARKREKAHVAEARARTQSAETEAREAAAAARKAAAEARAHAAAERARAEAAEQDPERSVVPWLRRLEVRLDDARRAAAYCESSPDAPLEQRVKMALGYLAASRGRVVKPVGTAA